MARFKLKKKVGIFPKNKLFDTKEGLMLGITSKSGVNILFTNPYWFEQIIEVVEWPIEGFRGYKR
jgi:hypothetical protein